MSKTQLAKELLLEIEELRKEVTEERELKEAFFRDATALWRENRKLKEELEEEKVLSNKAVDKLASVLENIFVKKENVERQERTSEEKPTDLLSKNYKALNTRIVGEYGVFYEEKLHLLAVEQGWETTIEVCFDKHQIRLATKKPKFQYNWKFTGRPHANELDSYLSARSIMWESIGNII